MELNNSIPIILEAIRKVGTGFLKDYKQKAIPENIEELTASLAAIDTICLSSLKADLAKNFPNAPWQIGDEFDTESQRNPVIGSDYWLCDAMDGAIQYLQHIAGWTINLVLVRDGQPCFSVIFDPLANEMFWAQAGVGAFMNNKPLMPAKKTDLSVMLAVFEYGHEDKSTNNLNDIIGESVTELIKTFGIVRNYGPHGLQLAYVGAGRIDFFIQHDLDTYNWIAGILIAKEAGAEILTTAGNPWQWGSDSLLVTTKSTAIKFLNK
ncbi:inositol monophosphatase family protein [Dyadobacter sp. CY345]|uniref:inositol monophosphatase family protein n=1 Tax=Dyadobacter sp. CY345 TaxID=2909335 RepID=UPI001F44D443|nr:inositol monophosphatase family protein [Dyadobacter sp. CY345]MCF2443970.1 inositol monophosphatase family protein [Dyadobacter sp. CY345]